MILNLRRAHVTERGPDMRGVLRAGKFHFFHGEEVRRTDSKRDGVQGILLGDLIKAMAASDLNFPNPCGVIPLIETVG